MTTTTRPRIMDHRQWVNDVTGGDSLRAVEKASGVPYRTVHNQLKANRVSAENVVAIAAAYGVHPVDALTTTGYLDDKWAARISPRHALRAVPTKDLLDEVRRRIDATPEDEKELP